MKTYESVLVALLLTAAAAVPGAAQQAPSAPETVPSEFCAGCFAYLEFPPSLEPERDATRSEQTKTPSSLPAADEADNRLEEQTAGLLASSKEKRRPAISRPDHKHGLAP